MATVVPKSTKTSAIEIVRQPIRSSDLKARKSRRETYEKPWRCNRKIFDGWDDYQNPKYPLHACEKNPAAGWDNSNNADFEKVRFDIEPLKPIEYIQYPKETQHYWYIWLLRVLEESCFEFGKRHLQKYLEDAEWRHYNLRFGNLLLKEHLKPDQVDLWDWLLTFQQVMTVIPCDAWDASLFQKRIGILQAVEQFRHEAIHRRPMPTNLVRDAMTLPLLFQDRERASSVKMVYDVVEDNFSSSNVDLKVAERARKFLYPHPDDLTFTSYFQLLRRIQEILEQSCFRHAARQDPHVLVKKDWKAPEDVELQQWQHEWRYTQDFQDPDSKDCFPDQDGYLFAGMMRSATGLRNDASHRAIFWEMDDACRRVRQAIKLAILLGERGQAVEIEVAWHQWLENLSRAAVLARLREDFPQERAVDVAARSAEDMRETWVIVDVFMGGEEDMREMLVSNSGSKSPIPTVKEQNSGGNVGCSDSLVDAGVRSWNNSPRSSPTTESSTLENDVVTSK